MEAMRQSWTDDRLDHLNDKVDRGFEQVDKRFEQVDERFEQVDKRFDRIEDRFAQIDDRLDAMYQLLVRFCGIAIVALCGLIASLVGVIATHI